ncbi:MAG: class I SAM-dependent methyltransferase [Candidatus Rokubacteria bacterium]|nr:class I SAM-dependent methyltransferase [Candidatus Rokubacteria bacterium]
MTQPPWEHPDWYDLHDTTWTAGPEREPEHYRELVLALPPLDADDHLLDAGCGTGKLAALVARGYPCLGRVTLVEPNAAKLERAAARLRELLPKARVDAVAGALGAGAPAADPATVVIVGSVLMPVMELRGGTLADGLAWLRAALRDLRAALGPGGWVYDVETLAAPWARGGVNDPVRRLTLPELGAEIASAGFDAPECVYRFRDRVIVKARRGD